jgi:preprotein translocase subunit SecE
VSDEKPGREDGAAVSGPDAVSDAELTDEQLDRAAPGVDDAAELEAAEDEVAAEAEADEDKVVAGRAGDRQSRRGRITVGDADEDDETPIRSRRAARTSAGPADRAGAGTRSRAAAERARTEARQRRSVRRFLREVVAELRKVIWPGRRELITYTTVVIVFVAFIVALVAGLDLLFAKGVLAVFG